MRNNYELVVDAQTTDNIFVDVTSIIEQSQNYAMHSVNIALIQRNWLIGKRIVEEESIHNNKKNYGQQIIEKLSVVLTEKYGKGFDDSNLRNYAKFYTLYKNIFDTVCRKSFLTWSHYRLLLAIEDKKVRDWYEKEALDGMWSVRVLQKSISTMLYYRAKNGKAQISTDIDSKEEAKVEFIRNPVVLNMLGLSEDLPVKEEKLESAILDHIEKFMLEMGKGYAFVGRQKRIVTSESEYKVDLVFFNYLMNCFVLVDLKIGKITHQDIGQIDSYVRMYDDLVREKNHNPTIGILLCDEIGPEMVRYSFLKDAENLYAAKYQFYIPSKEQLKAEITYQKDLFLSTKDKTNK